MTARETIYTDLIQRCQKYVLPGKWARFSANADLFSPPADPAGLLADLRAVFSDEELLEAGVGFHNEAQELTLHPDLSDPTAIILALRNEGSQPYSVVANGRCLDGAQWTFPQILADAPTRKRLAKHSGQLFIVFSMADLAVFRSIGLPTALGTELKQLDDDRLSDFLQAVEIDLWPDVAPGKTATQPTKPAEPPTCRDVVLVAWSPAQIDDSPLNNARTVAQEFWELHKSAHVPTDQIGIWELPADKLRWLRLAQRQAKTPAECQRLVKSLIDGFYFDLLPADAPAESSSAAKEWAFPYVNYAELGWPPRLTQPSMPKFGESDLTVGNEAIHLLRQKASATLDVVDRNLLDALANATAILQQATIDLSRGRGGGGSEQTEANKELFRQWQAATKTVQNLTRELRREGLRRRVEDPMPRVAPGELQHPLASDDQPSLRLRAGT